MSSNHSVSATPMPIAAKQVRSGADKSIRAPLLALPALASPLAGVNDTDCAEKELLAEGVGRPEPALIPEVSAPDTEDKMGGWLPPSSEEALVLAVADAVALPEEPTTPEVVEAVCAASPLREAKPTAFFS